MSDFTRQQNKQIRILLGRPPARLGERTAGSFLLRYVFFEALVKTIGRYYRESVGRAKSAQVVSKEALQTPLYSGGLNTFPSLFILKDSSSSWTLLCATEASSRPGRYVTVWCISGMQKMPRRS